VARHARRGRGCSVRSSRSSQSSRNVAALLLLVDAPFAIVACGQYRDTPLNVNITEGQPFAHLIRRPSGFQHSSRETGVVRFDHYAFRLAVSSPDALLVKGCRYENPQRRPYEDEVCSSNAFGIDTAHSYAAREVGKSDWDQATLIEGFLEMNGRRNLPGQAEKPPFQTPLPIGTETEREGYRFRGKPYLRRAAWMTALNFGTSGDGKLVVLAGYSRNHLSRGPFAIDIFDSDSAQRIAALDAESPTPVEDRLGRISIVNSRWLAVGLDLGLREMYLFDFKPASPGPLK
jgi:hypothetical protein